MVFYKGRIKENIIKDREVYIYGLFDVKMIVGIDKVVLIGGGNANVIVSKECLFLPMKKTIMIEMAYCNSILSIGNRHGILINHVIADEVYAKRTYIVDLDVNNAVLGELSIVETLKSNNRVVFTDPHLYIKEILKINEIYYVYKAAEA